jgi:predicted ribosome quality control (RQC) complex YloA/Tae2 family protein
MEGLLIHAVLRDLAPRLPVRSLGWAFPDEGTAALLLEGIGNLVLRYRPPNPILTLEPGKLEGEAKTPFQRLLEARVKGVLQKAEQVKLDRVVRLEFSGERGFRDTPPTEIIFELTGRNANLIVCDPEGKVVGLDRPVPAEVNRYRELRPGLAYVPPPPYQKLDPRTARLQDLSVLLGKPLANGVQKGIDGIGKELAQELARRAGLTPHTVVAEGHLLPILEALHSLVDHPAERTNFTADLRQQWEQDEAEALRKPLREALLKHQRTLQARLEDYQKALSRLDDAVQYRNFGDLLMAYSTQILSGTDTAQLEDFGGQPVEIPLEPGLSPVQNAEKYYARAKRLEANAEKALQLEPQTRAELGALERELAALEQTALPELLARLRKTRDKGPQVGARFQSPGRLEVWVGRSSKENDFLTRAAHSEDLWFHVQGIPGSHVILRTGGRSAALRDLLFAAQLAAFYSKAKGDKNVPVDYTPKKNVWRPRKAAPGQVLYTGGKTLFVDAELPAEGTEQRAEG